MDQQRLGYCVLLLVVIFVPNKSKENTSELLYDSINEQYDNTMKYFIISLRNQSVQTRVDENRTAVDEKDKFAQNTVPKNEGQAYANETSIAFFAIPKRYENRIYFMIQPRDTTKENKNNYIKFCCPVNHRFSFKQKKCIVDPEFSFPLLMNKYVSKLPVNIRFIPSLRMCLNGYSPYMIDPARFPDSEYFFYDDKLVLFPHVKVIDMLRNYCMAIVNQKVFDLITCAKMMHTPATIVATIVSSIFLLITFMVYFVLREFRKMHGYLLRAYITSLFVSNAMYAVYLQVPVDTMNYSFCASLSFIFLFAMYSAFLWLNVMCFNIWRTFREFSRLHEREVTPDRTSRRFMIYSFYTLGVSFVLTSLTIIMDFVPNLPDDLIKPNICKLTVDYPPSFWFGTRKARNFYFYLPIGIISICNTCLFVWIALKILCDKKRMKCSMRDSESRQHDDCNKKRLWMCLKLFILMVINWIPINLAVEVGMWIVDSESGYVWLVANLITCLQGIIIFIFFVRKKKVISLLMQRFGSDESSLCHFRKKRAVLYEDVALADYRDQHNEIRGNTGNTEN